MYSLGADFVVGCGIYWHCLVLLTENSPTTNDLRGKDDQAGGVRVGQNG